ncbi:putative C-14 sterol reductase [Trypanosoma vivax]|nr:putative C-14 sterol reductase [Trypanosoma vivax]
MWESIHRALPHLPTAVLAVLLWIAVHAVFYLVPVGGRVTGASLANGQRLVYNINGIHAFVLVHALLCGLELSQTIRLAWMADMFVPFLLASVLISVVISVVLYVASFRSASVLLATGGNTGNHFYDFWVGRELNPRTGSLDWKFMCELRPGLIGWSVLNWAFVAKSVELGTCSSSIVLVALLESFYVLEGLFYESGNLSMMDILHDGFGFMLCFGDLVWVPFTYTLKAKFLAYHLVQPSVAYTLCCCLLTAVGYTVFRGANNQKQRLRHDPSDKRNAGLRLLPTSRGKKLIISGYWGVCRHPNYVGDWLMTLSWSVLTGYTAILPYFQPMYFALLLLHRQMRDERQMKEKYDAEDLQRFYDAVPYRLVPYVY